MNALAAPALPADALAPWIRRLLWAAFGFALLFVVLLLWVDADLVLFVPVLIAGGGAAVALFRRPTLNLYVVLAGFVAITDYEEGLQAAEVLYGLYFTAYLAYWYTTHLFFYRDRLVRAPEDLALALFLLYAALSSSWAILFGAGFRDLLGEGMVLAMLAFYFPVKDVCARSPRATRYVLYVGVWFAVYVALRNLMFYRSALADATYLYQIAKGRVALNEILLMVPALGALGLLLYAQRWRERIVAAGLFMASFAGLILTQSRGYWAAFLLGVLALFLLTDRRRKIRIVLFGLGGVAGFVVLGALLFPTLIPLVTGGLLQRLLSLGTAFSSDISLLHRYYETLTVWEYIQRNPVLGYGTGVPFRFFDIIEDFTRTGSFSHNAYTGLWYKYGIVGLGLMLFFWFRLIVVGIRLFRTPAAPLLSRMAGLMCAVALIAELLVANTSTPFLISDGTLTFALLGGLASGSLAWVQRARPPAPGAAA
jgi:O-antigen ligase